MKAGLPGRVMIAKLRGWQEEEIWWRRWSPLAAERRKRGTTDWKDQFATWRQAVRSGIAPDLRKEGDKKMVHFNKHCLFHLPSRFPQETTACNAGNRPLDFLLHKCYARSPCNEHRRETKKVFTREHSSSRSGGNGAAADGASNNPAIGAVRGF